MINVPLEDNLNKNVKSQKKNSRHRKWFLKSIKGGLAITLITSLYVGLSPKTNDSYQIGEGTWKAHYRFLQFLPDRSLSRMIGWLGSLEIPFSIRFPVLNSLITYFNLNRDEFESELTIFPTLQHFFTRELSYFREISEEALVSPCDGFIHSFGHIQNGKIEEVKETKFTLKEFLGQQPELLGKNSELYYIIFNVPLRSYHRFHAPANLSFQTVRHFPGRLFSFKSKSISRIKAFPCINERVIFFGKYEKNRQDRFIAFSPIGSLGVGSINIYCDPILRTNQKLHDKDAKLFGHSEHIFPVYGVFSEFGIQQKSIYNRSYNWDYLESIEIQKGKEIGRFELGSSIAIIFEAKKDLKFIVKFGEKIEYGQAFCII